jgi:hypothetical protein
VGETGTISGIPLGTSVSEVVGNVTIPAKAMMNIIDENDNVVPMQVRNFDTVYVNTLATNYVFFEVIAEDGVTKITYQLKPAIGDEVYAYSDVFNVDQEVQMIYHVPNGIRVTEFFKHLKPSEGAEIHLLDKEGVVVTAGSLAFDDMVEVTNGTKSKKYYLQFLTEEEGVEAYVLSNVFEVSEPDAAIYGLSATMNLQVFLNSITPAPMATVKVLDETGTEITSGNIEAGKDKLVVTSGNGQKEVEYSLLISKSFTVTFSVTDGTDPIEGAAINVAGEVLTTDASGMASISLPNGEYDYVANKEDFAGSGSFTVADSDGSVDVVVNQATYALTLTVKDEEGAALAGASVSLAGEDLVTDASGVVSVTVPNGTYNYTITAEGYQDKAGSVTVSDASKEIELSLDLEVSVASLEAAGIRVYPNPSSGEFVIERPEFAGEMMVRIHNITGKVIFHKFYEEALRNTIVLDNVDAGVYFLEIRFEDQSFNKRLVIK